MKTAVYVFAFSVFFASLAFIGGFQWALYTLADTKVEIVVKNPVEGSMVMTYQGADYEYVVHESPVTLSWNLDNRGERTMYGKKECSPFKQSYKF